MNKNPPIFGCCNCEHCGGRWHLTAYCPHQHKEDTIVLTTFGEALRPYPNSDMKNERVLGTCIACHFMCNGFVDIKEVSPTHNALVCRSCHLRVVVPNTVKTFGDLRQWARSNSTSTTTSDK